MKATENTPIAGSGHPREQAGAVRLAVGEIFDERDLGRGFLLRAGDGRQGADQRDKARRASQFCMTVPCLIRTITSRMAALSQAVAVCYNHFQQSPAAISVRQRCRTG
jgi:hypothetical protein